MIGFAWSDDICELFMHCSGVTNNELVDLGLAGLSLFDAVEYELHDVTCGILGCASS